MMFMFQVRQLAVASACWLEHGWQSRREISWRLVQIRESFAQNQALHSIAQLCHRYLEYLWHFVTTIECFVRLLRYCLSLWLAVLSVLASSSDVGWLSGASTVLLARCQLFFNLERSQCPNHPKPVYICLYVFIHLDLPYMWIVIIRPWFFLCVYQVTMQWREDPALAIDMKWTWHTINALMWCECQVWREIRPCQLSRIGYKAWCQSRSA